MKRIHFQCKIQLGLPVERPESPELEEEIRLKKTESLGSVPVPAVAGAGERADPGIRLYRLPMLLLRTIVPEENERRFFRRYCSRLPCRQYSRMTKSSMFPSLPARLPDGKI